jgi:hypothetical protein
MKKGMLYRVLRRIGVGSEVFDRRPEHLEMLVDIYLARTGVVGAREHRCERCDSLSVSRRP